MRGLIFVEDEVAVDLVGQEDEVVRLAKGREVGDFLFGENAAHGVLRIAEDEDLGVGSDGIFEPLPVESPLTIDFNMIDGEEFHGGIFVNAEKGRVNRRAGEDFFSGLTKGAGRERESGDEASEMNDFLLGCGVADTVFEIALQSRDKRRVRLSIAEDTMIGSRADGVDDFRWRNKVHVSNPEGIQFGALVPFE